MNIDSYAANGWTPLTLAAKAGHADVVEVLLEASADVNLGQRVLNRSSAGRSLTPLERKRDMGL